MKNIYLIATFFLTLSLLGQTKQLISLNANEDKLEFKDRNYQGLEMFFSAKELDLREIISTNENFVGISNINLAQIYKTGAPNIPVISRLIEVPQDAKVEFIIKSFDEKIINLSDFGIINKVAPARRSQSKSEGEIAFVKNQNLYQTNAYCNPNIAVYSESGQMRSVRLGRIEVSPIQYNPVTNTLRILNNLVIEVKYTNPNLIKTQQIKKKYGNTIIDESLKGKIANSLENTDLNISQSPIHMVIVSHRMFEAQLAPFIDWKIKKGFKVTTAYTDVIGTTTTAIKSYLSNIYSGTNPMHYVLLVGDVQQVPSFVGTEHSTDLRYCEYTGDNLPEVFYGRFSAQTTAQLQPQIDKTLTYEKYLMVNPSYLSEVLLVAGEDTNFEMTHGNGQLWYASNYYFKSSNNINNSMYLQPQDNVALSATIKNKINSGTSFANYTAHCGSDGWGEPSFTVSDISSLTSNGKYGLWIGNCCQSNTFANDECFGEAALRKVNGGAIGYIGGSNNTTWDEDFWWGVGSTTSITAQPTYAASTRGMYDGYWHQLANETNTSSWYTTQGEMVVCGNLAVEASTSSPNQKKYYWEIYHLMGDPSVTNFIGTPQPMVIIKTPSALTVGMTSLSVTSAPYSYVSLSQNGVLIKAGFSNASGVALLSFAASAITLGQADLVVTAQNKIPSVGTITVASANQPFVVLNSYSTSVPTNFGQIVSMNVSLENVANLNSGFNANNVTATISTSNTYVTITDPTEGYSTINAGQTILKDNAFGFTIANNVPDGTVVLFNVVMTDNAGNTWNTTISVVINAPKFTIPTTITINDTTGNNNGKLDPGETVNMVIQTSNNGHASVSNVIGAITAANNYLTLNSITTAPTILNVSQNQSFTFNITASALTPLGTVANVNYIVTGGAANQYTANQTYALTIGFAPSYCLAIGSNTTDEYVKQVIVHTINNTTTQGPNYSDFSTTFANVLKNQSYPITIINGEHWDTDSMGCWVDWNYDGDFEDANETIAINYVGSGSGGTSIGTGSGVITVPANAFIGNNRLRTRVRYGSGSIACGESGYGEVEDYTLKVTGTLGKNEFDNVNVMLYPNPNNGTFTLNLSSISIIEAKLEIYSINGQLIYKKEIYSNIEDIKLDVAHGVYFAKISNDGKTTTRKLVVN